MHEKYHLYGHTDSCDTTYPPHFQQQGHKSSFGSDKSYHILPYLKGGSRISGKGVLIYKSVGVCFADSI